MYTLDKIKTIVEREPFDKRWNTVVIMNNDEDLLNATHYLINFFASKGDDSKLFLITKNEEFGYIQAKKFFPFLNKSISGGLKSILPEGGTLPGDGPIITTSSGLNAVYVCPDTSCHYEITKLDMVHHNFLCQDCNKKLVRKKV